MELFGLTIVINYSNLGPRGGRGPSDICWPPRKLTVSTRFRTILSLFVALLMLEPVAARAALIDFENFNLGGGLFIDVPSPLQFTNVGGSGVDVQIIKGADLRIYDLFQFGHQPGVVGQALIDWN